MLANTFVGMQIRGQGLPSKATSIVPQRIMMIPQYPTFSDSLVFKCMKSYLDRMVNNQDYSKTAFNCQ